ncbi:MAG: MgtC/SapB family protein [Lentisphaeria bacterium]|nr:MgtC/SapB family protein [Lentisphaeria bacterium]
MEWEWLAGTSSTLAGLTARMVLAMVLGAAIGMERDLHGRAAGLRTHMLVCLGSALFTTISIHLPNYLPVLMQGRAYSHDPARIAAQIVTGVGFLGAGTIIKSGFTIRGLTTATCLWVVAAIGMAVGAGMYVPATIATVLALTGMLTMSALETVLPQEKRKRLRVRTGIDQDLVKVVEVLRHKRVDVLQTTIEQDFEKKRQTLTLHVRVSARGSTAEVAREVLQNLQKAEIELHSLDWIPEL